VTAEARADAERQRAPLLAAELARVTAEAAAAAERQRPPLLADALSRVGREVREAAIRRCKKLRIVSLAPMPLPAHHARLTAAGASPALHATVSMPLPSPSVRRFSEAVRRSAVG
jgi:hypothetical protein